jgi:hypothetical protein
MRRLLDAATVDIVDHLERSTVIIPLPSSLRSELDALARLRARFIVPLVAGGLGAYFVVLAAYAYWPSLTRRPLAGRVQRRLPAGGRAVPHDVRDRRLIRPLGVKAREVPNER